MTFYYLLYYFSFKVCGPGLVSECYYEEVTYLFKSSIHTGLCLYRTIGLYNNSENNVNNILFNLCR